jgi:putative hydrolase of the HAD superfamily
MIRALIFDFDGTILDSETPTFIGWQKTYADHGKSISLEEYSQVVGTDYSIFDPRQTLDDRVGRKLDWTRLDQERRAFYHALIESNPVLPGITDLLREAALNKIPCAVASSSPLEWVEGHLKRLHLFESFSFLSCAGNGIAPKPAPAVYHEALKALGVPAGEAVAIEDSLNGYRAARCAGIPCVVVPNQITRHLQFPAELRILETLHNLSLEQLVRHARS